MLKIDLLRMSFGSLGSNKLRSGLTVLGIVIGVFSVVGVMTALTAIRSNIDRGLASLGANVFQISKYPGLMINDSRWNYRNRPKIDHRQAQRFKEAMEEEGALVTLSMRNRRVTASYEDRRTGRIVMTYGTDENWITTANYRLAAGRNLTPEDNELNTEVVVIGHDLADRLFPAEDPLAKMIVLDGRRFLVVGVLGRKGESFGESRDNVALVPISRFLRYFDHPWRSMELAVQAPSAAEFALTQDLAIGRMRQLRQLPPEQPNDFEVYSNDSLQASFAKIAVIVGTAGLLISAIALVTAGVGIMNIMLVSVTERTREIGVRKSLGARRQDVLRQFLLEAVCLSEIGALGGIVLGVIAGNIVARLLNVSMVFPWTWAVVAVVVCSAIGIGFGLYPAWKAASLKPVEALRFE